MASDRPSGSDPPESGDAGQGADVSANELAAKSSSDQDSQPETGMSDGMLREVIKGRGGKEKFVREFFAGLVMGPAQNPIAQKITPQHIDKVLETDAEKQRQGHSHRTHRLIALSGAFGLTLLFILVLAYMFRDKEAILTHLLTAAFSLLAGFVGGFGFGRSRKEE